jgi:hypothetical protein
LDRAATEIIEKSVTESLGTATVLDDTALPRVITPSGPTDSSFVLRVARVTDQISRVTDFRICLTFPSEPAVRVAKEGNKKDGPQVALVTEQLKQLARSSERITTLHGDDLRAVVVEGQCPMEEPKQ